MEGTFTDTASNVLYPGVEEKIEIKVGEEAIRILYDEKFIAEWDTLYQVCSWATVFQAATYTNTWYKLYKKQYIPILITSYRGNKLTGLLNLSVSLQKLEITGTGASDAYYHTWLAEEYNKESFIKSALQIVREHFPGYNISLFQLPPHTPVAWLETDKKWRDLAVFKSYDRPIVDLTHPELPKLFTKKQYKENCNRLKRLGEVTFEHITNLDQLSDIFDEMMDQFDFRKGATLNILPFRSDPHKKDFLMELFQLKLLHVVVLKMNNKIVASLIATIGKDKWVHGVGINTHAPTFAAYSPGFISFIMLAKQVADEGYKMLDLSTGDQAYKQRMANSQDQVYGLLIKSKPKSIFSLPDSFKKLVKDKISKAGVDYNQYRARYKRSKKLLTAKWQLLKQQDFKTLITQVPQISPLNKKEKLYKINTDKGKIILKDTYECISLNSIKDLLSFNAGQSLKTRWEFLAEAMYRMEIGEQVFACTENNRLKACIWLNSQTSRKNPYAAKLAYPTDGAVLHGLYFQPDYKKKLPGFLEAVCAEIESSQPDKPLYLIASPTSAAFCGMVSSKSQQLTLTRAFATA